MTEVNPGDYVLFGIPASMSDLTSEVWGLVLDRKAGPDEVWVVIDNGPELVMNRNPRFAQNAVVKIQRDKILQVRSRISNATISIRIAQEDDTILEMRRIDGKTTPMTISIDRGAHREFYRVDHAGHETLP